MHAVSVLQKCLSSVFTSMHAARARVLLGAVSALLRGRRLILMELARSWPGAVRVRAPLKRLDRLLSNQHYRLKKMLPPQIKPIIVTDAGFRGPWFRAVTELKWDYIGRLRHRTCVRLTPHSAWISNRVLHDQARTQPKRFKAVLIGKKLREPWVCDVVLVRKRRARARAKAPQHAKAQKANRDPWLLATSLTALTDAQVVAIYGRRMQIEQGFRDLKCDRFGCAFYYSLTRSKERLALLLLLHALATFVAWLSALAADLGFTERYGGIISHRGRRHYSLLRVGWERLRQQWETTCQRHLRQAFLHPPSWWLNELELPG